MRTDAIRILAGEDLVRSFQPDEGSAKTFCSVCGSNLFGAGWPASEFTSVRLSALEEPYEGKIGSHILRRSLAPWEVLPDDGAERFEVRAPVTQRIFPMVAYEDTAQAIDWLTEAFGFTERGQRYEMDDGTIGHAELEIGGEVVMLATPNREYQSPKTHRESCEAAARWLDNPWVIDGVLVEVDDLEAHHARAVEAGANVIRPPEDGPDGRLYTAEDLEGHRWMFQQR